MQFSTQKSNLTIKVKDEQIILAAYLTKFLNLSAALLFIPLRNTNCDPDDGHWNINIHPRLSTTPDYKMKIFGMITMMLNITMVAAGMNLNWIIWMDNKYVV